MQTRMSCRFHALLTCTSQKYNKKFLIANLIRMIVLNEERKITKSLRNIRKAVAILRLMATYP